ncbi:MAG: sigma-70 family RNA polymerase sigma factor [Acidobacteriota bacterium]|nr:sigma-70 family RNA polymerase sigma factor [Acidobacteriota bacterium]MDH3529370.1 sigma-70 family RNA polymerase sigma factor [Acidobacteriota bacterium]
MSTCIALDSFEFPVAEVSRYAVSYKDLTDHQLIDATREGDEDAFAEIVERYRNQLTNYLYRMLNDYEESVDLAQESFVRVYFAIERYHSKYAFSTYIYRIATNLAISEIRKRKRRRLFSLTGLFQFDREDDTEYQPADVKPLPEDDTMDSEKRQVIQKAIFALPEKYRVPIVLREIQELTYEEVANVMGLGLGTTKSRISRGRGLLRERLKHYFDDRI